LKLPLRPQALGVDTQPAIHRSSTHHEPLSMGAANKPIRSIGLNPHEESSLPARTDRHVAVDEERESPEHALLGHAALAGNQGSQPLPKIFVERHARIVRLGIGRVFAGLVGMLIFGPLGASEGVS
jgi:hypothetical protein